MFGRKVSGPQGQLTQPNTDQMAALAITDNILVAESEQHEDQHLSRSFKGIATQEGQANLRHNNSASIMSNNTVDVEIDSNIYQLIREEIFASIDPSVATKLKHEELTERILHAVTSIANQQRLPLTYQAQQQIAQLLLADMLGLGPLQSLLDDDSVNDILINGFDKVYVERNGKLSLTNAKFRDESHLLHVARRIASAVGRRIDESKPMVDARLADGSRVNIVIPPLSLSGTSISIRKFSTMGLQLQHLADKGAMSTGMVNFLKIISHCRLNILVSGGTGAGKTTLLNALSYQIDEQERIVTIEDAAELKLQQAHVVTLESRPESLEGGAEVSLRDLLKNALRMRPDRIIIGEVRGEEAFEMMQAMNTGHDGSMSTLHANSARDALIRLENMLLMGQVNLPPIALKRQMNSAIDIVMHVERMRDGKRRITSISELVGIEGENLLVQDLFSYKFSRELTSGELDGEFISHKIQPHCLDKVRYYGLETQVLQSLELS
ncbi:CpaF family protein [Colwellia psychrerythraea]|uniref:Type II secretion system protein E n=1 Tax=Colwellia psychrerythraea TaxID=28229 RepID=A0A099KLU0_COLPS|nr:CpaF family protein [Colwellia psychrerythraea]KGJ91190.1 type II secretion system protein E [Colwellia psychrerythraea]